MAESGYVRRLGTHFLREWRRAKGYSLRSLADKLENVAKFEMSHANIGRIENGEQPYTEELLEALADIYRCKVVDLLSRKPEEATAKVRGERDTTALLSQISFLPEGAETRAYKMLVSFFVDDADQPEQTPADDLRQPSSPRRGSKPSHKKSERSAA